MIKAACMCDRCDRQTDSGFVVIGNVNTIDSDYENMVGGGGGGVIGNNLEIDGDGTECGNNHSHYCRECMVIVLFGNDHQLTKADGFRCGGGLLM